MKFKLSPQASVSFVKMSVFLACSWPPRTTASKAQITRFRFQWWFVFVLLLALFLPLLNGVWTFRHDTVIAVKAVLMTSATAQALMKIIVCKYHQKRFQDLLEEMEIFLTKANIFERHVLDRYLETGRTFHGLVTVCVYLACLGFILEPLLLAQPFPTDSSFPFAIEFRALYVIIYMQQAVAIFHIAAALSIDNQVAMLFWYTAARFEMLGTEIKKSRCKNHLVNCIKKHQKLLVYAAQVTRATRFVALATAVTTTIGIICGGLTLISHQPLSVKLRVANMVFNASVELFVYAWPADKLMEMSRAIGNQAYESAWLGKSKSVQTMIICLIQRCQKPVIVSVGGFLPSLSLYYYASFLSSSFSYFSTMRIVYNDVE